MQQRRRQYLSVLSAAVLVDACHLWGKTLIVCMQETTIHQGMRIGMHALLPYEDIKAPRLRSNRALHLTANG